MGLHRTTIRPTSDKACWKSFPTDALEMRRSQRERHFQMSKAISNQMKSGSSVENHKGSSCQDGRNSGDACRSPSSGRVNPPLRIAGHIDQPRQRFSEGVISANLRMLRTIPRAPCTREYHRWSRAGRFAGSPRGLKSKPMIEHLFWWLAGPSTRAADR
jgi:hypothetical protein